MSSRQYDASMIHLGRTLSHLIQGSRTRPLKDGATTGRAPVRHGLFCEFGVALTANSFHH
jgi:hypothetical protein